MTLKCHLVFSRTGDQVICACGRTGSLQHGGVNDFTFWSPSGKTRFQAITDDRPEPRPRMDCEACLAQVSA